MTPEQRRFEGASILGFIFLGMSAIGFILMLWDPDAINMGIGCLIPAAAILVPLHWPRSKEDNHA